MSLDFSSRVNRPSFRQLNNSISYNNQYHYEQGNIYLKPQYVYDAEFSLDYGIFDFKVDNSISRTIFILRLWPSPANPER